MKSILLLQDRKEDGFILMFKMQLLHERIKTNMPTFCKLLSKLKLEVMILY
jgi:hypothetical protein